MLTFSAMVALLITTIPIFAVMGICSLILLTNRGIDWIAVPQSVFEALDSFALLAVPFYVLAGNLMKAGGISRRLVALAKVMVGWLRGGMGAASVLTCMFFSTMSGSSSATTAAVASTMVPAMQEKGYPKPTAAALVAVGGELGAIIPPSLPMVIYALVANVSIGNLFIAGILPGVFVGLTLIVVTCLLARIKDFDRITRVPFGIWFKSFVRAFLDAGLALMMPVIILGGIYSGIFTATEASVVAVVYGFIVGVLIYREVRLRDFVQIFCDSAIMIGMVMLIVGFAALFGFALTINQIPQHFGRLISEVAGSPIAFLLMVNVLLFIVGTFMEALATILILSPILSPIAQSYGIDPIHFCMIFIVNVAIGMVTPPVAINLNIASQVTGVPMMAMTRPLLIFLFVLIIDTLIITFVPALSLALL